MVLNIRGVSTWQLSHGHGVTYLPVLGLSCITPCIHINGDFWRLGLINMSLTNQIVPDEDATPAGMPQG